MRGLHPVSIGGGSHRIRNCNDTHILSWPRPQTDTASFSHLPRRYLINILCCVCHSHPLGYQLCLAVQWRTVFSVVNYSNIDLCNFGSRNHLWMFRRRYQFKLLFVWRGCAAAPKGPVRLRHRWLGSELDRRRPSRPSVPPMRRAAPSQPTKSDLDRAPDNARRHCVEHELRAAELPVLRSP